MGLFSIFSGRSQHSGPQADTPRPKKRTGIMEINAIGRGLLNKGATYSWMVEVEEQEQLQSMSKVKVLSVSGGDREDLMDVMAEWVPSREIMWRLAQQDTRSTQTPPKSDQEIATTPPKPAQARNKQ